MYGVRLGLETSIELLSRLGNPQRQIRTIQVAGSNGKGTTAAMLAGLLHCEGRQTSLFTSPHLCRIEERYRINGRPVSTALFEKALGIVQAAAEGNCFSFQSREDEDSLNVEWPVTLDEGKEPLMPTFFEATYLTAMVLFSSCGMEFAVVETGLGGRYDATTTCEAEGCIITSISLEHTDVLGSDLPSIAREKAAIVPDNGFVVIKKPDENEVLTALLDSVPNSAQVALVSQSRNVSVKEEASSLAKKMFSHLFNEVESDVLDSLQNRLQWPGRMQIVSIDTNSVFNPIGDGNVVIDAAHNPVGMKRLVTELSNRQSNKEWHILLSASVREDISELLLPLKNLSRRVATLIVVEVTNSRKGSVPSGVLAKVGEEITGIKARVAESVPTGVQMLADSLREKNSDAFGLITGSIYLVSAALTHIGLDTDDDLSLFSPKTDECGRNSTPLHG